MKTLSDLVELNLGNVVTDREFKSLAELKKLRRLDLTKSAGFTDAGLATLMSKSPKLQSLEVMFRCDGVEHNGHK